MKENQRTRLSKLLLQNSLIELLGQKSINAISVREICTHAQINRTTFYKYYGSPYDLLTDMENKLIQQIEEYLMAETSSGQSKLPALMHFFEGNINFCRILLNNNVDSKFPEMIFHHPLIRKLLFQFIDEKKSGNPFPEYTFTFVINGAYCVIKDWISKDIRETPEELSAYIEHMIESFLMGISKFNDQ